MEFRNSIATTGVDIPARVAQYVLRVAHDSTGWRHGDTGTRGHGDVAVRPDALHALRSPLPAEALQ